MPVKLQYMNTDNPNIGSITATFAYQQFNANGAYDVNPIVGSSSMPGFTEWTGFYSNYRVYGCKIVTEFINTPLQTPFNCGIIFLPVATSALNTWAHWQESMANRYCRYKTISYSGGLDRCIVKNYCKFRSLIGSREYTNDISYSALISGNPTITIYAYVFVTTTGNTVIGSTSAVNTRTIITMYMTFYKRIYLST